MSQSVADIPRASLLSLAEELELIGDDIHEARKQSDNIEDLDNVVWRCAVRATKVVIEAGELGFTAICPALRSLMQSRMIAVRGASGGMTDTGYRNLWTFIVSDNRPEHRAPMLMPADEPEDEERRDKLRFIHTVIDWRDACRVAAAKLKAAPASNKPTVPLPYLELRVDANKRTVTRDGSTGCAEFEDKQKPWQLFTELFKSGAQGLSRDQLMTAIWPKKPVQPNTLDQHKGRTNDILQCLRLEIRADNRGIWTLTEM